MRSSILSHLGVYLILGCVLGSAHAADKVKKEVKESDEFFQSAKIVQLNLEIGKTELDALRREPRKYAKAVLKEGENVVFKDVGIHLKGAAGSFRGIDDKPNITVNMDKFVDDQRFHGMDKLHLTNSLQDPSYVAEYLCGELFRAAGVPASRVSFALVSINGKSRGLFYIKEGYDQFFLTRHFGSRDGNFYDGGFLRDLDQALQLVSTKKDVANHDDLKALLAAAREKDLAKRYEKLEQLLDLDRFLSFCAVEVITWDWDGYPMNRNNYRLYHNPKTNKMTFIPSGMDQMFGDPNGTIFPNFQGEIARALIETPKGKERYLARMAEIMKTVYKPDAMVKRLDELQERLVPALTTVNQGAGRDLPNQINRLRQAVKQREKSVNDQLAKLIKK